MSAPATKILRRTLAAAAALAAGAGLMVGTAPQAAAVGKSSIYSCTNRTISSDQRSMSVVCDTLGDTYRFEVKCANGTWVSSPWTRDRTRATANCGSRGKIVGVGATVYYQCYPGRYCAV